MAKRNGNGNGRKDAWPHNTKNLRPGWKKGQSGNPKGRPKGTSLTGRLLAILAEDRGKVADKLIRAGIQAAEKGDFNFWREIMNRVDGKVPDHQVLYDGAGLLKEVKIDLSRM